MKRIAVLVLVTGSVTLCAGSALGVLTKYYLKGIAITEGEGVSPGVIKVGADYVPQPPYNVAVVDDTGPDPVLAKFVFPIAFTTTVEVPELAGPGSHIFLSNDYREGIGPLRKPKTFTGSGSTSAGSTVAWGVVTGWTVSGAQYCKSAPPVICSFATLAHETTSDPIFNSDFYDLGTWTYHGTGWTAVPFVVQYFTTSFGNNQQWLRGFPIVDFSVPALPLIGVLLLGGSLLAGAVSVLRRDRRS